MADSLSFPPAEPAQAVRGGPTHLQGHVWTLIDPPFLPRNTPSLEMSVLAAALGREAHDFERPNLVWDFAARTGTDVYDRLSGTQGPLGVGDFIGGAGLRRWLGQGRDDAADALRDFLSHLVEEQGFPIRWQPAVHLAADVAEPFTEDWAARLSETTRLIVLHAKYQQLAFALSLAEALARQESGHRIVLSGDLVHRKGVATALLDMFPFLHGVAPGRLDHVLESAYEAILGETRPPEGLVTRAGGGGASPLPASSLAGVALTPDFGSFHEAGTRPADASVPLRLSVGCAWGDKTVCSFCGLIPNGQTYVTAQPEAALDAIVGAVARTGCRRIVLADLMVDENLIDGVFAPLAEADYDLDIYAEVRPNLSLDALRTLRRAGVREILAGIESLDRDTLKALRKGQHPAAMVRFLRDVDSAGLSLDWQILHGLPLDTVERAEAQAALAARLRHLPAPFSASPIRLERGSPMAADPAAFGMRVTGPARHTELAFAPLPANDVMRICDEFSHTVEAPDGALSATRGILLGAVTDWVKARNDGQHMTGFRMPGGMEVQVTGAEGRTECYRLDAAETAVLDSLAAPADRRALGRRLPEMLAEEVDAALAAFLDAGFVVEAGGRFVHVVPRAR